MTVTTPLTCDGFANALADYLERDDSPRVRAAVEAHATSCVECGALLADVQQLRLDASGLPTLTPPRDLWAGIEERIATPVIELGQAARGTRGGASSEQRVGQQTRRAVWWLRPAAAAAALVVVTAGVTYFATREALLSDRQMAARPVDTAAFDPQKMVAEAIDSARRAEAAEMAVAVGRRSEGSSARVTRTPDGAPEAGLRGSNNPPAARTGQSPSAVSMVSDQAPVAAVENVYGREIARLWRIVDERRAQLDTSTVGVLERNLNVIDQAIRESRAALARDPASAFLNEQLTNVLEQKVELLRAVALLPVRS